MEKRPMQWSYGKSLPKLEATRYALGAVPTSARRVWIGATTKVGQTEGKKTENSWLRFAPTDWNIVQVCWCSIFYFFSRYLSSWKNLTQFTFLLLSHIRSTCLSSNMWVFTASIPRVGIDAQNYLNNFHYKTWNIILSHI